MTAAQIYKHVLIQELGIQPYLPAKTFWPKLVRFVQIWMDLSKIWEKLRRNLAKIEAKFGKN